MWNLKRRKILKWNVLTTQKLKYWNISLKKLFTKRGRNFWQDWISSKLFFSARLHFTCSVVHTPVQFNFSVHLQEQFCTSRSDYTKVRRSVRKLVLRLACCLSEHQDIIQFPLVLAQSSKFKLFLNLLTNFVAMSNTKYKIFPNYFLHIKPHILFNAEVLWKQSNRFLPFLKILLYLIYHHISLMTNLWGGFSEMPLNQEQDSDLRRLLHMSLPCGFPGLSELQFITS